MMKPVDDPGMAPVNILLVDDEPANLLSLQAVLGDLGENLVCAQSGEEALRQLLSCDFAVILLDLYMPTMSGFKLAQLIRARERSQSTPIIFVTASDSGEFPVEEAYALGAVDYLTKPINPTILRAKVAVFVELYRKTEDLARSERKRHAAALNAKDERIRLILENARGYAFIVTDLEGRVTEWEGGAAAITGWSSAEIHGQSTAVIFTPEDQAAGRPRAELELAMSAGIAEDKRWHIKKDGGLFFADGVVIPLRDASGHLHGFAKIFRDATVEQLSADEVRAGEAKLHESRGLFSLLLESSVEGIFGLDDQGLCTFANTTGANMLGYRPDELVGHAIHEVMHHHHADGSPYAADDCRALKAAREGVAVRIEDEVFWHKNGTSIPVSYLVSPMIVDNRPAGAVITFSDITQRRQAELERERLLRQLQAANDRMAEIFRQAPAFMCVLRGPDHVFESINDRYLQLIGNRPDVIGQSVRQALPELQGQGFFELLDRVYATGDAFSAVDMPLSLQRIPGAGRDLRYIDLVLIVLRDSDGSVTGTLLHGVDQTERKLAEEQLRRLAEDLAEADRRKTEFLATLAHELRNPLAPIRSGLSVIELGGDSPAMISKVRKMMDRQVSHMVRLVDDLLDIARISGGKIALKKERISLKSVIATAIETSMPAIEAAQHKLDVQIDDETLFLYADPTRIAQVISNLLNNSAKYTASGGHIELFTQRDDQEVLISVKDNGVGIPEESLPKVFDMFNQVRRNLDRAQGGLGIGLSLVQQLVEKHEGTVSAASDGVGKGSTFAIRLPLAIEHRSWMPDLETEKPKHLSGKKFRILVVDDNIDAADTLSSILELSGHTTRIAHDGTSAIESAREFVPEIVFLDIGMPGMSGYEVARSLRKMEALEQAVLVALTGWGSEQDRVRTRDAGFDQHLTKPVEFATVDKLLSDLAKCHEPDDEMPTVS